MLEIGSTVRYASIGSGEVVDNIERKFQGKDRVFAVIFFPHKNMEVQLPIGDPVVNKKIFKVYSKTKLKAELRRFEEIAEALPRTWDVRAQIGDSVISSSDPGQWIQLLASYAYAEGAGVSVAASDADIVRTLKELLSAELCCSDPDLEYEESREYIDKAYSRVVKKISKKSDVSSSHYAGIEIS